LALGGEAGSQATETGCEVEQPGDVGEGNVLLAFGGQCDAFEQGTGGGEELLGNFPFLFAEDLASLLPLFWSGSSGIACDQRL
jgi:hypothetical protein